MLVCLCVAGSTYHTLYVYILDHLVCGCVSTQKVHVSKRSSPRQNSMPDGEPQKKSKSNRFWASTVRTLRIPRSTARCTRWWTGTLSLLLLYTHFRLLACSSSSILLRQCKKVWSTGDQDCRVQDAYVLCMQGAVHDSNRVSCVALQRQTAWNGSYNYLGSLSIWLVNWTWWIATIRSSDPS